MNQDRIKFLEDLLVAWAKDIKPHHDVSKFDTPTDALLTEAHRIISERDRLKSAHSPSCGLRRMTCKGCKFYVAEVKDGVTSPFGFCQSPHVFSGYDRQLEKLYADHSGIHVENDEGWGMYVGEDFGCIHFADRGLEGNVA